MCNRHNLGRNVYKNHYNLIELRSMKKNINKNISRRQFIKAAGLTAGTTLMGCNLCKAKNYKGKTRSFSTNTDCDVTFYAVADTHFVRHQIVGDNELKNKQAIDKMNYIPGNLSYPASVGGGLVDAPRGLIMPGDLTDFGTTSEWNGFDTFDGFKDNYCGNGTGRLNCPVYEGFGNHDFVLHGTSDYVKQQIKIRNLTGARPGVSNVSSNGYHYSFNWDTLHMVNLNLQPTGPGYAENSIEFLESDLQTNVGDTGRAVILYFHSDFDREDFWDEQDEDVFYDIIKDYNVIAIFYGHAHVGSLLAEQWRGINIYNVGLTGTGKFAVAHITNSKMVVAECVSNTTWGVVTTKSITA